jgi:hypothetical protein
MDNFRVSGMPTPPLDAGFGPEDTARTSGGAPTRRAEMSGGLANAAMTDHVGGNDPAGPNVADWLDAPGPGQDIDMGALMVTLHQAAVTFRSAMHEAQQVERDAQVAAMRSEATDIRNSAGFSFAAAVVTGALQIAGGALEIGGAAAAYRTAFPKGSDGMEASNKIPKLEEDDEVEMKEIPVKSEDGVEGVQAQFKQQMEKMQQQMEKMQQKMEKMGQDTKREINFKKADFIMKGSSGLSQAAGGLGQIISGGLEYGSHQKDADEKEDEANATKAAALVADQDNLLKNIDDLISGVRQIFSQMIEAKNESMNKITQA